MKKAFSILIFGIMLISLLGAVSAGTTYIAGKIYNSDYSATVGGATVEVTCALSPVQSVLSKSDGAYSVQYDESVCHEGSSLSVHAFKTGVGENTVTGLIHDDYPAVDINLGVVNVPLVPEFGAIVAGLTILSALGVFFIVRKR